MVYASREIPSEAVRGIKIVKTVEKSAVFCVILYIDNIFKQETL